MKGETDESYNNEFRDLQLQLFALSGLDFNGMSIFANHVSDGQEEILVFVPHLMAIRTSITLLIHQHKSLVPK